MMAEATIAKISVGVRELKNQLSHYLGRVKAGEEILVTQHGVPIARLSAVGSEIDNRQAMIDAGILSPARTSTRHVPDRRIQLAPGQSIDEIVAEQRR